MPDTPPRSIMIPENSPLSETGYRAFLDEAYRRMASLPGCFAPDEGPDCLELAHIVPDVPETVLAVYVGINDAVCNKELVTRFLVRHAHNCVFAFVPGIWSGHDDVPPGTVDARAMLNGFEPPNGTWDAEWTYVMIEDPWRSPESLWRERGYIDMIAAKHEDFTLMNDERESAVCFFIEERAFDHPVNRGREYLTAARRRGEAKSPEFGIPAGLAGETAGLVPVILRRGEKLYVATPDFRPCAHAWSNIHPDNRQIAVVNENSAVPLDLIVRKPPAKHPDGRELIPARGSADMTTDTFFRGKRVFRKPLLAGKIPG